MTRATYSMMVSVSSLEAELKAVRVASGDRLEMSILGNMPATPKKVTPMIKTQLLAQARSGFAFLSMALMPISPARATAGISKSTGLAR